MFVCVFFYPIHFFQNNMFLTINLYASNGIKLRCIEILWNRNEHIPYRSNAMFYFFFVLSITFENGLLLTISKLIAIIQDSREKKYFSAKYAQKIHMFEHNMEFGTHCCSNAVDCSYFSMLFDLCVHLSTATTTTK